MRAFIVRPFGERKGIDFNLVEHELIAPALESLGIQGRTTMEITEQGNIRLDMFQLLLTSDLVIADISIHNANVFYELGIRHALRNQHTFLIRCDDKDTLQDDVPFDLKTDRYLAYTKSDPRAKLEELIRALEATKTSDKPDSPVFQLLPELEAQDPSRFLPVPRGFQEEVEHAAAEKRLGDLGLLATEAQYFPWALEGLRVVGREQFRLKAFKAARSTWEAVLTERPDDVEANTWLGTIYERLKDLTLSDQALKRVLAQPTAQRKNRAEALSLEARNAKTRWKAEWQSAPAERQTEEALRSGFLEESSTSYWKAFEEDLNHYYPGLNALAMLKVLLELARALPEVWADRFNDPNDAAPALADLERRALKLAAAVEICFETNRARLEREEKKDLWLEISEADLLSLISDRPRRVADAYRKVVGKMSDFDRDAVRQQLLMYEDLGILKENVKAALEILPPIQKKEEEKERVLLFTGHRIDASNRTKGPRFPAAREQEARDAIRKAVLKEREYGPIAYGLAGAASGGDILFHEVCEELEVPTQLYLALPENLYIVESVQDAGSEWVERFNRLSKKHPEARVLAMTKDLPRWLRSQPEGYLWQRNNLWMLHNALADEKKYLTLIALWDGKDEGDGPGGTADLVRQARQRGAKAEILDTKKLFGLE